jgi:hypothetical protein
MPKKFLVVFEDLWGNKDSYFTDKIGTTIKKVVKDYELRFDDGFEPDYDRYDSKDPYDRGTFSLGFYDIECLEPEDGQYAGKFMIFDLAEAYEKTNKKPKNKRKSN